VSARSRARAALASLLIVPFAFGLGRAAAAEEPERQGALERETGRPPAATPYKGGEGWPLRNASGLDFCEPLAPIGPLSRGDLGRVCLNTALPCAMLASAFAFEGEDGRTLAEFGRWDWLGIDEGAGNYPMLGGMLALSALGILLPVPAGFEAFAAPLRIDRATVFAAGVCAAAFEAEILKRLIHRRRPNGEDFLSRPSGHASVAFASASFLSDVLRGILRPEDEGGLLARLFDELACALPYAGAAYVGLSRVHAREHYLTDVLLGGALGALTMHMLYSWSFARLEQGEGFVRIAWAGYDTERRAFGLALAFSF